MLVDSTITQIIKNALNEDIGDGDITTSATVSGDVKAKGTFLVKESGIIAGLDVAEECFKIYDENIVFTRMTDDGSQVEYGDVAAVIEGSASSMLTVERTALNFLQRMSGIATSAGKYINRIKHTDAKILDTRKTVPGLRAVDKLAVKTSGCINHRIGLYDMFLIKDNHISVAGSITKAVLACKNFREKKNAHYAIEVETTNLDEITEALECGVDFIMLDNFSPAEMKKAVKFIDGRCKTEASGGITLETVKDYAETGVDYISVGALTHSVKALDISLEISPII